MIIVIVIPTYNERDNIKRLITALEEEVFPKMKDHDMNILVVDDASPDGTADEVKKLMNKWKNLELITGERRGLGDAYIRGMTHAVEKMGAGVLFEMDAELSNDPEKIIEFVEKINEGYDMVVGTRYSGGGSIPKNWALDRKAFSILGNLLIRTIFMRFYIHDWTGGFRAIRRDVFEKEKNELKAFKGYTFQVAFLHKAVRDGFKITEVPIHFRDRISGRSKLVMKDHIVSILRYIITARAEELTRIIFRRTKKK